MSKRQRPAFMEEFNKGTVLAYFEQCEGNDLSGVYEGDDLVRIWKDAVIMVILGSEEANEPDDEVLLEAIISTEPNRGRGGKALDWLTGLADEFGISIRLHSDVSGMFVNMYLSELGLKDESISQERLDALYKKKGWVKVGDGGEMLRRPKGCTL